ncbi:MAG: condensation domain-containing protein [Cellvibrionaceae bacterium]|nr:condensation domain-containing protein [Cellvibrionaceae bacterium]
MLAEHVELSVALSPEQRALVMQWGDDNIAKKTTVTAQVVIEGQLNYARLRLVVENLRNAHGLLRTALRHVPGWRGLRMQQLDESPILHWCEADLRCEADLSCETDLRPTGETTLSDWVEQFRAQPMATERGELIKAALVHLQSGHVLVLVANALVMDRAGLLAFIGQMIEGYRDGAMIDPENLFQYPGFVEWRQSLEDDEAALLGREYWNSYIAQNSGLESPRHGCRWKIPRTSGLGKKIHTTRAIDHRSTQVLERTANALGCPVDILLQGAWWLLLVRLTGFESFIAGWLHDCRRDYEVMAGAAGVFEKILPVAIHIQADTSFAQWLATFSGTLNNHIEAQEYWNLDEPSAPAHLRTGFAFYEALPERISGWRVAAGPGPYPRFELALQIDWSGATAELLIDADASRYCKN